MGVVPQPAQQMNQFGAQGQQWYDTMMPHMRTQGEQDYLTNLYNQNRGQFALNGMNPQNAADYQVLQDRFGGARNWYDSQLKAGVDQTQLDNYYNANFGNWMNTGTLTNPVPWA